MSGGGRQGWGGRQRPGRALAATMRSRLEPWLPSPGRGSFVPARLPFRTPRLGLPGKLLVLTILFVMLAEVLIFLPSIANFRVNWLTDRLTNARLASLAAEAVPEHDIPEALRLELLSTAKVLSVAIKQNEMRRLVLPPDGSIAIDDKYDLRPVTTSRVLERLANWYSLAKDAMSVLLTREDRTILVFGHPFAAPATVWSPNDFVEIVLEQAPLRQAMLDFALRILLLSIFISILAAALVYLALHWLLVQPMIRITHNMVAFGQNPENASLVIEPSQRTDEVGTAERELASMQKELQALIQQKSHLAALGLAVSKINHDLRNMLASTQLLSDRLAMSRDPNVQSFAPKLIASLDRAITFCNDTLRYGRAEEAAPRRDVFRLADLVEEVGDGLALPREGLSWIVDMEPTLMIDADRSHLFRVLNNIGRNAVQAIEQQGGIGHEIRIRAQRDGRRVVCEVSDTGPGVPEKARANLFRAFTGSARKGGTGLGLAIAAELVAAHGGKLQLAEASKGATFRFDIPDRGAPPG